MRARCSLAPAAGPVVSLRASRPAAAPAGHRVSASVSLGVAGAGAFEFTVEPLVFRFEFQDFGDAGQVQALLKQLADPPKGRQVRIAVLACSAGGAAGFEQALALIQPDVL